MTAVDSRLSLTYFNPYQNRALVIVTDVTSRLLFHPHSFLMCRKEEMLTAKKPPEPKQRLVFSPRSCDCWHSWPRPEAHPSFLPVISHSPWRWWKILNLLSVALTFTSALSSLCCTSSLIGGPLCPGPAPSLRVISCSQTPIIFNIVH